MRQAQHILSHMITCQRVFIMLPFCIMAIATRQMLNEADRRFGLTDAGVLTMWLNVQNAQSHDRIILCINL